MLVVWRTEHACMLSAGAPAPVTFRIFFWCVTEAAGDPPPVRFPPRGNAQDRGGTYSVGLLTHCCNQGISRPLDLRLSPEEGLLF